MHHGDHHHHHFRFAGRRGGFPFGGGFDLDMEFGGRGNRFRLRRQIGGEDLRLVILLLLEDGPRHGYDLIKAFEQRTAGAYSPSPGVIYPALTYLEEAGHIEGSADGNRKVYAITGDGRAHLAANREHAEHILARLDHIGERVGRAREHYEQMGQEQSGEPGPDRDIPGVIPEVNAARKRLKAAIAAAIRGGEDDQRRIAEALNRAADDIGGPDIDI